MRNTVEVVGNIDESIEYIDIVHGESKGYITIVSKDPNYKQWHYKIEEVMEKEEVIFI